MIWFIVPAHGRLALSTICFAQLARVCDALDAEALVIAEDGNLDLAAGLFEILERPNSDGLGRRFNDGFEHAAKNGADYVVPLGSDDWVDPALFTDLPDERTAACFRSCSLVDENGSEITHLRIPYDGGIGIRILPTALLAEINNRPADDSKERGVDTSMLRALHSASNRRLRAGKSQARLEYRPSDPLQIIDFKTHGANLNSFAACWDYRTGETSSFADLERFYPAESVRGIESYYGKVLA